MRNSMDLIKSMGVEGPVSCLCPLRYTSRSFGEAQRQVLWWTNAPVQAVLNRRLLNTPRGLLGRRLATPSSSRSMSKAAALAESRS
jgi:hypothetical protein